ncbi:phosphomannomutase/phosphoglucomutase [candidate division WWE3 bacterium CG08_land_8_20_14_0_20_40_13]|uniref:Phosphomannomutase/phosphoglucomutase n=1 Tax=candidate division WWE3 bacterium CG08_land_8_20_14_0_20_40_13 TaxID=1975084 RepID=A0A2H0XDM0_UNCKA|nr:MAG: phosphomannomutase/phosphoglucomutase [candidate division WWE3 bacterium CG08_land_8_20_14_0_20_40_13]
MTNIDPAIFKALDIRGLYPSQINESNSYTIAKAVCYVLKPRRAVVSKDVRLGSDAVYKNFIEGLLDSGCDVDFIGEMTTDSIYFAVGKYDYDLGIAITGSHNPKEYTGFKITKKGVNPVSGDGEMPQIKDSAMSLDIERKETKGTYKELDILEEYANFVLSFVDAAKIKPLKIAVDCGNGVSGALAERVFTSLNLNVIKLFFNKDGNFPNHIPDPLKEENLKSLKEAVLQNNCDLGIAFDGDGDRMMIVDDKGNSTNGYYLMPILIEIMLLKYPRSKIVHEPRQIWAIVDTIRKLYGTAVISKTGHSFIKEVMRKNDAVFGGETSGHFFYRDNFYADNGIISALLILEYIGTRDIKVSEILNHIRASYPTSGEINNKVDNADSTLEIIKTHFLKLGFLIDELDGITVVNNREWRFNLRKSNTEPLVRLNVEGKTKDIVDKIVKEVLDLVISN